MKGGWSKRVQPVRRREKNMARPAYAKRSTYRAIGRFTRGPMRNQARKYPTPRLPDLPRPRRRLPDACSSCSGTVPRYRDKHIQAQSRWLLPGFRPAGPQADARRQDTPGRPWPALAPGSHHLPCVPMRSLCRAAPGQARTLSGPTLAALLRASSIVLARKASRLVRK